MTTTDLRGETSGQLIVGLDVPSVADAEKVVEELGDAATFYKIGYQLVFAGGLDFAKSLIAAKKKVFLDMKLLDIDNTIAKGVENVAKMGVSMLTLHAYPKAMRSAVQAAQGSDLCLLGVTVLTSMDDADLKEAVVTPGIRPAGAERGDQKRVMTPSDALKAGASHLVVARPIVGAQDRRASALAILDEMRSVA